MHGVRISVCISDDKRHEFFQSVSSLSPSLPISVFHVYEDTKDRHLFNLTADCIRKEPLEEYLHSDRLKKAQDKPPSPFFESQGPAHEYPLSP